MNRPQELVWRTVPYISASGSCDVRDYLENLFKTDKRAWQQFENIRREIIDRGPFHVGPPHWVGLGDGLYEIRWRHHRIYCSIEGTRIVMMYVAVLKLWPKFRKQDRQKCETRRDDVRSPAYDEQQREYLYRAHCQRRSKNGSV